MATFGETLHKLLRQRKLSQTKFASEVEVSQGLIALVISGKRPPPIEAIDKWVAVLSLNETQGDRFKRSAAIAHLPESYRGKFEKFLDEHEDLKLKYQRLEAKVAEHMNKSGSSTLKDVK